MDTLQQLTDLLDKQANNQLSPDELSNLEALLASPENQAAASRHQLIRQGLIAEGRKNMRALIQDWEAEKPTAKTRSPRTIPLWATLTAVAAAIALIVLMFFPQQEDPFQSLLADAMTPYPNILMPVERGSQAESMIQEAFAAYEQQEYARAIDLFDQADTTSAALAFYRANALMGTGDDEGALAVFQLLATNGDDFAQQAEWYAAMILWKKGDTIEANEIIERIHANPAHEMWKRADRWKKAGAGE